MPVVTISRGSFSGGSVVAGCFAEATSCRVVSREMVISAAAKKYGVAEEKLTRALQRPPGLWERFGHERRLYLTFIQAALCDMVEEGGVVYHGHAGHLLLRGVSHVLRVRLIAPVSFRVAAAMERLHLSRHDAEAHVRKVDEERAQWTRFLYGIDWHSPALYDLTVNLEMMSVETACGLIHFTSDQVEFQPTDASRKKMRDLALSCRVRAALCARPETASLEVEVKADDGAVELSGTVRSSAVVDLVQEIAAQTPGVTKVLPGRLGSWHYGP